MNRKQDGFTLVEVIVAITVLAVLVMPILAYFTRASVSTSKGKDIQKAEMAAQSVAEELRSCTTFEQIEDKLAGEPGSTWQVEFVGTDESKLARDVTVDGTSYRAKVTLDYDYSAIDESGNPTAAKFNDYEVPQLSEIYSPDNVVISEDTDQSDIAAGNFYYEDTSVDKAAIKAAMDRTLCLDVTKQDDASDFYQIKAYYQYEYNGKEYTAVMKDTKAEADTLSGIYLFYNILRDGEEALKVNFHNIGMEEAKKLKLYFIHQKTASVPNPTAYSLRVTGEGTYMQAEYFTNGVSSSNFSVNDKIVTRKKQKRIANVTVDVYDIDETAFTDENRLVRVQTAKGE